MSNLKISEYTVDGTDADGNFAGDGENAPFVVFNITKQEFVPGQLATRAEAEDCMTSYRKMEALLQLLPYVDEDDLDGDLPLAEFALYIGERCNSDLGS